MSRWVQLTEPTGEPVLVNLEHCCIITRGMYEWKPQTPAIELTRILPGTITAVTRDQQPYPFNVLVRESPQDIAKLKPVMS